MPASRRLAARSVILIMALVVGSSAYEVEPGDTLSRIASRFDVSVEALVAANQIADPDLIRAGTRLLIPGREGTAVVHVVGWGETLGALAGRYGTTVGAIAAANALPNPDRLAVGQRLSIPNDRPPDRVWLPDDLEVRRHTVRWGETLMRIAREHRVGVTALAAANALSDPDRLVVGDVIDIPAWVCPVPGSRYINDWGFPRSGGRFHAGTDLFAAAGTPVLAPVSGTVEQVEGETGGVQFWLDGDDGNLYIGSHLQSFGKGGRVAAGEVVGYVGDSGNARGSTPHLHFEILPGGGDEVNPFHVLQGAC